jgi:hypothetical protein
VNEEALPTGGAVAPNKKEAEILNIIDLKINQIFWPLNCE